jgi:hypothetical protein
MLMSLFISAHAMAQNSTAAAAAAASVGNTPAAKPISDADLETLRNSYAFRARMNSDPVCQSYAQQADTAFLDSRLTLQDKTRQLSKVAQQARAAACTN